MFYSILDEKRKAILSLFVGLPHGMYLAGGTALALQLGHRDSVDFDFFTQDSIDTEKVFEHLRIILNGHTLIKTHEEKDTLYVVIDDSIKISFMTFKYPLIRPLIVEPYIQIASQEDIACMKLSAISARAMQKDYVDIFFLLQKFTLTELLQFTKEKMPELNQNLILKSLVFFDDVEMEPIKFTEGNEVDFSEVKNTLQDVVRAYTKS